MNNINNNNKTTGMSKERYATFKLRQNLKNDFNKKTIKIVKETIDVRIDLSKTYMLNNYLSPEDEEWRGSVNVITVIDR